LLDYLNDFDIFSPSILSIEFEEKYRKNNNKNNSYLNYLDYCFLKDNIYITKSLAQNFIKFSDFNNDSF
jgi:hypothetical protein